MSPSSRIITAVTFFTKSGASSAKGGKDARAKSNVNSRGENRNSKVKGAKNKTNGKSKKAVSNKMRFAREYASELAYSAKKHAGGNGKKR